MSDVRQSAETESSASARRPIEVRASGSNQDQ